MKEMSVETFDFTRWIACYWKTLGRSPKDLPATSTKYLDWTWLQFTIEQTIQLTPSEAALVTQWERACVWGGVGGR